VLTIVTTNGALHQNSVQSRLQHHGLPVTVKVTECTGYSSGIGQAITYYGCRGNYTLDAHTYNEMIGGSRAYHRPGTTVPSVAVPGAPALVAAATSVTRSYSGSTPYATPAGLGVLTVATALLLGRWVRRPRPPCAPAPPQGRPHLRQPAQ
jgi:hypothetical protein